ncbi:MAG: hypothetical protein KC422_15505 [Trueperaceae bacterium]|nr:hypothetical protein [Trueperaceae bacterium]
MTRNNAELRPMKLLTLVSEGIIEDQLLRDLRQQGINGYTAWEVHGEGHKGHRRQEWEDHNIRLEILLSDELLSKVLKFLKENYFPYYAMTFWVQDVESWS